MLCSAEGNKSHTFEKTRALNFSLTILLLIHFSMESGILQIKLELAVWSSNEAERIGKAPHMQDT